MRTILIPQTILVPLVRDKPGSRPMSNVTFEDVVCDVWTNSVQFTTNMRTRHIAGRIYARFVDQLPGARVVLEEEEWELLCEAVKDPTLANPGQAIVFMKHIRPFEDAVLSAPHEEPGPTHAPPGAPMPPR